jgi:hypothetical protein
VRALRADKYLDERRGKLRTSNRQSNQVLIAETSKDAAESNAVVKLAVGSCSDSARRARLGPHKEFTDPAGGVSAFRASEADLEWF